MSISAGILMSGAATRGDDGDGGSCSGNPGPGCLFQSVLPLAVSFIMITFVLAVLYGVYKRYKANKELRNMSKAIH